MRKTRTCKTRTKTSPGFYYTLSRVLVRYTPLSLCMVGFGGVKNRVRRENDNP
jgi:hypothetical protein